MRLTKVLFLASIVALTAFSSCELLDEDEDTQPEKTVDAVCTSSYKSISDAQLNAYCGAAYAYRCQDGKALSNSQVQSVCSSYNSIKTSSAPSCTYCK
ncbi:MAG: hypothetical protein ABIN91_12270 [Mucilaginibacter sp.]|uniref:hypothetical protein n=1 Tax=Mucilaginibacter sp. TaxID=1882438 RepID=UPI003265657E